MDHKHRWALLDRLTVDTVVSLPQAIYAELAELLREAMQDRDPAGIRTLATQLADIVKTAMRTASGEARAAAQGRGATVVTPADEAFALGRLGFAYQLAASFADKRTSVEFESTIASVTYAPYVRALLAEELTGTDLAERLGQRVETVSRNLKTLRAIGAVDYRREQTSFINFLTPAARHLLDDGQQSKLRTRLAEPVRDWVRSESQGMPQIMRDVQTFAQGSAMIPVDRESVVAGD